LIISSDAFNASRINTVIAIVITSNTKLAQAPGNVLLSRKASGLAKTSVANVSQVITLDKSFLSKRVKKLAKREFAEVEDGLRLVLSLS
jgi:mRNA interferase MazF